MSDNQDNNGSTGRTPENVEDYEVTVFIEGPGDNTVRPARPVVREHGLKEREKIAQWEAWKKEQHAKKQGGTNQPPDSAS